MRHRQRYSGLSQLTAGSRPAYAGDAIRRWISSARSQGARRMMQAGGAAMSLTMSRRFRWLAPVAVAATVLAGGVAIGAVTAALDRGLPERSPEQLLVDLQTAQVEGLSGTIVYRADLGLPQLPGVAGLGDGSGPSLASLAA